MCAKTVKPLNQGLQYFWLIKVNFSADIYNLQCKFNLSHWSHITYNISLKHINNSIEPATSVFDHRRKIANRSIEWPTIYLREMTYKNCRSYSPYWSYQYFTPSNLFYSYGNRQAHFASLIFREILFYNLLFNPAQFYWKLFLKFRHFNVPKWITHNSILDMITAVHTFPDFMIDQQIHFTPPGYWQRLIIELNF